MGSSRRLPSLIYSSSSSQSSLIKPLITAYFTMPICSRRRRYSQEIRKGSNGVNGTTDQERAPSTLEEFRRVAEAKARQGFVSQTVEKAQEDAHEEAAMGDGSLDSVNEKYKKPAGVGNFHKTGDDP